MKTFTETIKINNTKRQLHEMFFLMSQKGIDPIRFVDWYTLDGIEKQNQGLLVEASEEWLREWEWLNKIGRGIKNVATGNVDYSPVANVAKTVGGVAGNLATAPVAATMAGVGGLARGVVGAGADNLWRGAKAAVGADGSPADPAAGGAPAGVPHAGGAGGHEGKPGEEGKPAADPNAQHMQNAHKAIDTLSKRMGNSKTLAQELGGPQFQSMVANMLHMIQNNQALQPQQAPAAGGAPPTAAPVAEPPGDAVDYNTHREHTNGFANFTGKIRLKNEIRSGLRELQEYNVDPVKFVDWYIEEGQYLEGDGWDKFKAGVGGYFRGDGYFAGRDKWQNETDKKRDDEAVQQAINALTIFDREMKGANFTPDFAEALKQVRAGLHKRAGMAAQAGGEGGAVKPPTDPAASPDPAADGADPGVKPAAASGGTSTDANADPEKESSPDGPSDEQLKQYVPIFQEKLKQAGADMTKFADPAIVAEIAKQALTITRKDGHRDAFIKHVSSGGDPKTWTPPAAPPPDADYNTHREHTTPFYAYLKRRRA